MIPASKEGSKVLLVGDVHGDAGWLIEEVIPTAKGAGAICIIQLGDFGFFWPGESHWWDQVSKALIDAGIDLFPFDGNHENFEGLKQAKAFGARLPVTVAPRIHYLPRGYRWTWNGNVFMTLGGAYSIDKWARLEGYSWWPEEEITQEDVDRAVSGGHVDVILSHDVPWGIYVPGVHNPANPGDIPACVPNRMKLLEVTEATTPKLLVHGHYHVRYQDTLSLASNPGQQVRIVGLAQERKPSKNHVLLDVTTLDLHRS